MKNYDTIIFDLDGTLLNTLDDLADSVNYTLAQHGYPSRTTDEVRQFVGNGVEQLMTRCLPTSINDSKYDDCLCNFKKHYSSNMRHKTAPYSGIMELVQLLAQEKYKLAVVSNKFDDAVKKLCAEYFGGLINVAIGESKDIAKKPAPDTVLKALQELRSSSDKAVYVGDSEVDVETAKNTGLICVGVTWGFRDREVLQRKGADYIIDKPSDLLKIVGRSQDSANDFC